MIRPLRIALCGLCAAVLLVAGTSAPAARTERMAGEARYAELMEKNVDFAAMENEFAIARDAFMKAVPLAIRDRAERLLALNWYWDLRGRWDEPVDTFASERATFLAEREPLLRYMRRVADAKPNDAFLAALLPPLLQEPYDWDEALALFDTAESDYVTLNASPSAAIDGVTTRIVGDERWHLVVTGTTETSSPCSDAVPGYVIRPDGDSWRVHCIIAPMIGSFFPTEGEAPELAERDTPSGWLYPPDFFLTLRVTNDEGPFELAMDLDTDWNRSARNDSMAYIVVPECPTFPFVWSEAGQTYVRGDPECGTQGGKWGAFSPFQGNELIPVARYRQELMRSDSDFKAEEDALAFTWEAFSDLFAGEAAEFVKTKYVDWLLDREVALVKYIGNQKAFAAVSKAMSAPVADLMREVFTRISGAEASPDATLLFLLDPLHSRFLAEKGEDEYRRPWNSDRSLYLRYDVEPWLSVVAAGQLRVLAEAGPEDKDAVEYYGDNEYPRFYDRLQDDMWQFSEKCEVDHADDGMTLVVRRDSSRARYSDEPSPVHEFTVGHGQSGEHWGLADVMTESYYDYGMVHTQRITRIANGKISFVTPPLPGEEAFFADGREHWPLADGVPRWDVDCDMYADFAVDIGVVPFTLNARYVMAESPYNEEGLICVPECSVPYVWNGSSFVPGDPVCLPAGQWGVVPEQ